MFVVLKGEDKLTLCLSSEGWNSFMHDYTLETPYCTESGNFLFTDCGSASWAFGLFIVWNIVSMYLFLCVSRPVLQRDLRS
jgi:hypothetical protein